MRYLALASDYDGTLAHDSHVSEETLAAIDRLKDSGRKVILVTGREMPELQSVFPEYKMCDAIVAENGALLVWPQEGSRRSPRRAAAGSLCNRNRPPRREAVFGRQSDLRDLAAARNRASSTSFRRSASNIRSSSTSGRSWSCPAASTKPPGLPRR